MTDLRRYTLAAAALEIDPTGAFCIWIFDLLGARPTDEFVDIFPGSGAVGAAWHDFSRQPNQLELTA